MEKEYHDFLHKMNNDIEECKVVLDCCCNEIHLALKRLENRSLEKRNIAEVERINNKIKAENEMKILDFHEVDELIQKAKKVLTFQDSKTPAKKGKAEAARPKSTNILVGKQKQKNVLDRRDLTAKVSSKSKSANPRIRASLHKSKEETPLQETTSVISQSTLPKEALKEHKVLSSPYNNDFLHTFLQSKKISKILRSKVNKNSEDTNKVIQQFMDTLRTTVSTKASASIQESDPIVESILHYFASIKPNPSIQLKTEIKDLLLNHVKMENSKMRLDFLLTFSSFLKRYFLVAAEEQPQKALRTYRLVHHLLGGSMPVLLQDENIEFE